MSGTYANGRLCATAVVCAAGAALLLASEPAAQFAVSPAAATASPVSALAAPSLVGRSPRRTPGEPTLARPVELVAFEAASTETPTVPFASALSLTWLVYIGLPLAGVAALVSSLGRRAVGGALAPVDVLAVAPLTGYRVAPQRAPTALAATPAGGGGERYEVELEKPIGITLARGSDGATYVAKVPPGPKYAMFTPGDRVTKCSASFGPDIWDALNYGQVMFAIKTRNGNVFLELEKRDGDLSCFETNKASRFLKERNSGNYGSGTMEMQMKNYSESKELQKKREAMWREGVDKVRAKKYEDALVIFENVIGLEPAKYIGDNFALQTDMFRLCHYQMACVYSLMGNADASLESLREAMRAGFDDFKQIRSDPDLARVRETEEFEDLMGRFDESPFNTDAINALKGVFGFFGGKK